MAGQLGAGSIPMSKPGVLLWGRAVHPFLRLVGALLLLGLALFLGCLQLGWQFLVGLGDRLGWRDKATWLFLGWILPPCSVARLW